MDKIKDRIIEFVKYKRMTMKSFENSCGLSNGYINSMRKGFGREKLSNVLNAFPELNREWLLYGEGEMITMSPMMTSFGDNSPNVSGDGNRINDFSIFDKSLKEISEQRKLVSKSQEQLSKAQEQIDRLLAIIEKMSR